MVIRVASASGRNLLPQSHHYSYSSPRPLLVLVSCFLSPPSSFFFLVLIHAFLLLFRRLPPSSSSSVLLLPQSLQQSFIMSRIIRSYFCLKPYSLFSFFMARQIAIDHIFKWVPCPFFIGGRCRAGSRCHLKHETESGLEDAVIIKLGGKIRLTPPIRNGVE